MEIEKNHLPVQNSQDEHTFIFLIISCTIFSWIFLHRWNQRNKKGPKTWPLVGAAIEQFMNFDRMHDWLVNYLTESRTVVVPMPFTTYTYIADPYSMGRLEYNWGPDAASFKPERWLKDGFFQNASPFKFTAFQAGPRICLGKDSAYLQMKMALAILCRFFKFELVPGHLVKYRMMTILSMANGLKVSVSVRP